jgi:hypothetical protein
MYSDRRIEFIQVPAQVDVQHRAELKKALEVQRADNSYNPKVLAVLAQIEWYVGEPIPILNWLTERRDDFWDSGDEDEVQCIQALETAISSCQG